MLLAIMSDIHSNFLALKAVLKDAKSNFKPDKYICLGDIIGYGAQPNECVEVVKENNMEFVYGNHEISIFDENYFLTGNKDAKISWDWTKQELTQENMNYLRQYHRHDFFGDIWYDGAFVKKHNKTRFVHASLPEPQIFRYVKMELEGMDPNIAIHPNECFRSLDDEVNQLFVGHTHEPEFFSCNRKNGFKVEKCEYVVSKKIHLENDKKYIVNVGSVGQPRDHDVRASYVLFDTTKRALEYRRIYYDYELASGLIIAAGLPEYLGKRLLIAK